MPSKCQEKGKPKLKHLPPLNFLQDAILTQPFGTLIGTMKSTTVIPQEFKGYPLAEGHSHVDKQEPYH